MGKLTKLKEDFKIENIKEAAKNALEKIGMGMIKTAAAATIALSLAGGFMGCNMNPEIDYCEICEGIQDEYHEHEKEQGGNENGGTEQGGTENGGTENGGTENGGTENGGTENGGTENGGTENGGTENGGTENGGTETCNQDGCKYKENGTEFEKGAHTTHDYCDKYGCANEDSKTDDNPHKHCEAEDCKDHRSAYTGEHNHVCKDNCLDKNVFNGDEHTHDYCNEDGCLLDDSVKHTTHDYCPKGDCDGSTHKNQAHPEYESWFQEATIGGENSPIKIRYVNLDAQPDSGTAVEKNQDRVNQYKKYIESFTINNELSNVKLDNTVDSFDALIGSSNENSYYNKNGINDICKPAIEEIAKNVAITNEELDLDYFYLNFRAFENEVYGLANDKNSETYTEKKAEIEKDLDNNNKHYNINYSIYQEDGTIHPNALQRFDEAIKTATTKLIKQGKNVTKDDLYNIIILSFTASAIQGTHDYDASSINHSISGTCTENEMVDVIYGVDYEKMTPIVQAKLNKSIFSQDMGRELC